jgi:hypothetical protein
MEDFDFKNYVSELHLFSIDDLEKQKEILNSKIINFVFEPYLGEKIEAVEKELKSRSNDKQTTKD